MSILSLGHMYTALLPASGIFNAGQVTGTLTRISTNGTCVLETAPGHIVFVEPAWILMEDMIVYLYSQPADQYTLEKTCDMFARHYRGKPITTKTYDADGVLHIELDGEFYRARYAGDQIIVYRQEQHTRKPLAK